jgi:hypothetical protein
VSRPRRWPPVWFIVISGVLFAAFDAAQVAWLLALFPHVAWSIPASMVMVTIAVWAWVIRPVRR